MTSLDVTVDGFLGGRLQIRQPRFGYRAGADAVLLAAAVEAKPGQSVLELGLGVGVPSLCLAARVPALQIYGVEQDAAIAALAEENAAACEFNLNVVAADLMRLPSTVTALRFDHVMANPPYFDRDHGSRAKTTYREAARGEAAPLRDWIDVGLRRLRDGGAFWLICKVDRLPEVLGAFGARAGDIRVWPMTGRMGRSPDRFLLSARKGARGAFRLCAPLVLHEGAEHGASGDYTAEVDAVLRSGQALTWP